jgi:hypothetical protein
MLRTKVRSCEVQLNEVKLAEAKPAQSQAKLVRPSAGLLFARITRE